MKKVIIILFIFISMITGCEDKEKAKEYRIQGEKNAINYIKNKYNINPKIIKVENRYKDIYIYGKIDNYRYDDILKDGLVDITIDKSTTDWYGHETIFDTLAIKNEKNKYELNVYIPKNKYNIKTNIMLKENNCLKYSNFQDEKNTYYKSILFINNEKNLEDNLYFSLTKNIQNPYEDECH